MLQYETNGETFDFPVYERPPKVRYVLASTPRSGSNMLTRALWHTKVAGFPEEYFTDAYVNDFVSRWNPSLDGKGEIDDESYLQRLMRIRTSPNGVFGVKLHSAHLRSRILNGRDLDSLLQKPKYIWITRTDRIRQAISYILAEQTGVWIIDGTYLPTKAPAGQAAYDFRQITHYLDLINADVRTWEQYFKVKHIRPHIVVYEDLVEDYEQTLRSCLAYIGVDVPAIIRPPGIEQQAGGINEEWYQRYTLEARFSRVELGLLCCASEHPLGSAPA